jgi:Sugar kinases, ribokinase family
VPFAGTLAPGSVFMVVPHFRPSFFSYEMLFREPLERIFSLADIVRVSDEDFDWLFPEPATVARPIDRLRDSGPALVILTPGGAGVTAW